MEVDAVVREIYIITLVWSNKLIPIENQRRWDASCHSFRLLSSFVQLFYFYLPSQSRTGFSVYSLNCVHFFEEEIFMESFGI